MTLTKETIIPPKDHILEARKMAEGIYRKPPHIQIEMFEEIKKHLIKQQEGMLEQMQQL